jgi:hypothetical protein
MLENTKNPNNSEVPKEIADFVRQNFSSVSSLEVFLLVRSLLPAGITAEDLGLEMRSNSSHAANLLEELVKKGLLTSENQQGIKKYFCRTNGKDLSDLCDRLSAVYNQKRFRIINLIYESSLDKLKTFADAFKIRK